MRSISLKKIVHGDCDSLTFFWHFWDSFFLWLFDFLTFLWIFFTFFRPFFFCDCFTFYRDFLTFWLFFVTFFVWRFCDFLFKGVRYLFLWRAPLWRRDHKNIKFVYGWLLDRGYFKAKYFSIFTLFNGISAGEKKKLKWDFVSKLINFPMN